MDRCHDRAYGPPYGPPHEPLHGSFHERPSGSRHVLVVHLRPGSPYWRGGGMKQRGGMHKGTELGSGGDGGGGHRQHWRMAPLAQFRGRHQPKPEVY